MEKTVEKSVEMFDLISLKPEFISIHLVKREDCIEIGVIHNTTARVLREMPANKCDITFPTHVKVHASKKKLYIYGVNVDTPEEFNRAAEKAGCDNPYTISLDEYLEFYKYSPHRRMILHEVQLIVRKAYHATPDSRGGIYGLTKEFIDFCKEYNSKVSEEAETIR